MIFIPQASSALLFHHPHHFARQLALYVFEKEEKTGALSSANLCFRDERECQIVRFQLKAKRDLLPCQV
ncbi:hypothetical protein CEXT_134531 [Caerostris extrusa]|uniref:Uncharacterized protein n=1 Tax=Caerostris extrusa TaxID=172846 RepID=A0AAV4SF79_CAEEX|nr:hypothetical protein CEXT_134531 [Caerostris extrusa]